MDKIIYGAYVDVERSSSAGFVSLSRQTLYLFDVLERLRDHGGAEFTDLMLRNVKNSRQVYSTLFEIRTYFQYADQGLEIESVVESNIEKRPDFEMLFDDSRIAIECKSLQNKAENQRNLRRELFRNVKKMFEKDVSIFIELRLKIFLSPDLINGIIDQLRLLQSDSIVSEYVVFGSREFSITLLRYVGNSSFFSIVEYDPTSEYKRISNNISSANKQFRHYDAGIVHIELPYEHGETLMMLVDDCFYRIARSLKNMRKIAFVLITGCHIEKDYRANLVYLKDFSVIVPNKWFDAALPSGFRLPVIQNSLLDLVESSPDVAANRGLFGSAGQIDLCGDFSLMFVANGDSLWNANAGAQIFTERNTDASRQLIFWVSYDNHFRFDFIDNFFEIRIVSDARSTIPFEMCTKILISASETRFRVCMNGVFLSDRLRR